MELYSYLAMEKHIIHVHSLTGWTLLNSAGYYAKSSTKSILFSTISGELSLPQSYLPQPELICRLCLSSSFFKESRINPSILFQINEEKRTGLRLPSLSRYLRLYVFILSYRMNVASERISSPKRSTYTGKVFL